MSDWSAEFFGDISRNVKWRVVARRSWRPVCEVIAVFVFMLTQDRPRLAGTAAAWDDEDIAAALDTEPRHVAAIRKAMQGKLLDGDWPIGWAPFKGKLGS